MALGKLNNLYINKLYTSSNKKILHSITLIININFSCFDFIIFNNAGIIKYTNNSPHIPNTNTLLKHTYPPILPKLSISLL